jgi:hypothetical protein
MYNKILTKDVEQDAKQDADGKILTKDASQV